MHDHEYQAIFCPRCGEHLNNFDYQDSPDDAPRPSDLGSAFTCGWCRIRTRDWGHVRECRISWPQREEMVRRQAMVAKEEAVLRLTRVVADLTDLTR